MKNPIIVGAGLAGLIAAHAWPSAQLIEAGPAPRDAHKALLRFRSDAVAKLVGVEFRKVRVRKGIWYNGSFVQPNIRVANLYSQKCLSSLQSDRSIWNIDAADRFIAPDNFYEQLLNSVYERVSWGEGYDFGSSKEPVISTAPLPLALASCGIVNDIVFQRQPIRVHRWTIPNCDVFQTIYFPHEDTSIYRASITGNMLIVEMVSDHFDDPNIDRTIWEVESAFGIGLDDATYLGEVEQKYGKIAPIDEQKRKAALFKLTHEHNVFSLGRFATWRNLLLDDVVEDITVVKRLLRSDLYELRKHASA